ncbi:hypothetical protein C4K68_26260 [Pokkaliibacter plantistimulans]|uniref:Glycosyl transferase n=1 Tax=Proteobacteria bacterium 228 TaxID=2083153 RepID=A0A2S5KI02_9PROT|nr:hypothetical protein [Pokkaliibacter plantistimulans]PPC74441.1 hypothetical protein C4K68_26260 [Pokkaliibacter plantistimulans]
MVWQLRKWANRHRLRVPAAELSARLGKTVTPEWVESLVIPVVGLDYVEEGSLTAEFAARFYPELKEIVLVTDVPADAFGPLPAKARVVTLDYSAIMPRQHAYTAIYKSRLVKISAPLQARYDRILMTDSDLMMLQNLQIPFADDCLLGCFRRGKMISKVRDAGVSKVPVELSDTYRPYIWDHLNGAFLAGTKATWERLSPAWIAAYISIWSKLPDNQPPTDQLPLCCVLDHLQLYTVDLGDWVNWPVSKKMGGKTEVVPAEVIGAHGGFPLSEWRKYLQDPTTPLSFIDANQTRKLRYLTDAEKGSQ